MYRFPVAFQRTGIRFLDSPIPAKEFTVLTVGLPATLSCRDPDEVPMFRVVEKRPGWVPSIRRGRGVHTTGPRSPIVPRRFPATSPLRRTDNPSPAVCVTTHTKIHFHLPPGSGGASLRRRPLRTVRAAYRGTRLKQALKGLGQLAVSAHCRCPTEGGSGNGRV